MLDQIYKYTRKSLNPKFYRGISNSIFGRSQKWSRIENYQTVFNFYQNDKFSFEGKTVLEIGSGAQLYTALFFMAAGAKQVILVDPKWKGEVKNFKEALNSFNQFNSSHPLLIEVEQNISCLVALTDITPNLNNSIDFIGSYLVLEHFSEISSFFAHVKRLLSPLGISRNKVDLSDHTYHIFGKYPFTRNFGAKRCLYHLRYSNNTFAKLNDPKCFMNRILFPEYLKEVEQHQLSILNVEKRFDASAVVHPELIRNNPCVNFNDLQIIDFNLDLSK